MDRSDSQPMRAFPFVPKSIKSLEPGDFFPVCLEDGRYACGRVLQLSGDELPTKTRSFFGGLHDWVGTGQPTEADVAQAPLLEFGAMHVRAIQGVGAGVIGNVPLSPGLDEIPILLDSMGGPAACVLKGVVTLRPARRDEWGKLSVLEFWGLEFIKCLAERRFAGQPADAADDRSPHAARILERRAGPPLRGGRARG